MDINKYIAFIQLNHLFRDFSHKELLSLFNFNNYKIAKYQKEKILYFESEKCITLDMILEGKLIVQRIDENGNILTITQFNPGDVIGGNLLFGNNNAYPMSIIVKSNAIVLHMKKDFVLDLCQHNKRFLIEFLNINSNKALILTNKIKSISFKSLRESIVDFLSYKYYSQKTNKIILDMTKKELAERLGVQRTSLSRELNKMRKEGLIEYDAKTIIIKDLKILK